MAGRSSRPGRRRPEAPRAESSRAAGSTAAPGAPSLDEATRPRPWQDLELRPLADPIEARPLFDFAAVPWPEPWISPSAGVRSWRRAAHARRRARRASGTRHPSQRSSRCARNTVDGDGPSRSNGARPRPTAHCRADGDRHLDHAAALGADTAFARPQGLDRVWIRYGFIPVPEAALPAAFAHGGCRPLWLARRERAVDAA